jgi:hypothetical protein
MVAGGMITAVVRRKDLVGEKVVFEVLELG